MHITTLIYAYTELAFAIVKIKELNVPYYQNYLHNVPENIFDCKVLQF